MLPENITLNILVCGYTGAGKTSLIKAMFNDLVPDSAISHGMPCTVGFKKYKTDIFQVYDSQGMDGETKDEYIQFIQDFISNIDQTNELIHLIWYCIDGSRSRLTEFDKIFIRQAKQHLFVVVTKREIMRPIQRKELKRELSNIIPVSNIIFTSSEKNIGIDKLIRTTVEVAPKAQKDAVERYFSDKLIMLQKITNNRANQCIFWAIIRAIIITIIPLPMVDLIPLVINEFYMMYRLSIIYEDEFKISKIGCIVPLLFLACFIGQFIVSFIPGIKIIVAAGVTLFIGSIFKDNFVTFCKSTHNRS